MVVEGSFYKLYPSNEYSLNFDLELLHDIGGKNPRQEFKNVGYGYTLEHAIKAIIMFAINKKFKEETVTLKEFLEEYKQQNENLKNELKLFDI